MARKRRKGDYSEPDLPMTPMIDVVFQLFIYFIMTMKPIDIFTHLNVSRPSEDKSTSVTPLNLLRINIYPNDVYSLNDRRVSLADMEKNLGKLADKDPNQTVLIISSARAKHDQLVNVLNICAKLKLTNLSVLSAD